MFKLINIKKLLWNLKRIEIFSEHLGKEKLVAFKANENQLFSIIKNYKLYKFLEKNLSKNKFFRSKFSNEKKLSFLKKYELIINCDSSNSITNRFFSKKITKRYNSKAYTTIITHEQIANDTAFQIFTKKGPLAFLPISKRETSIVYSVHNSINKKEEILVKLYKIRNEDLVVITDKVKEIDRKIHFKYEGDQKLFFDDFSIELHFLQKVKSLINITLEFSVFFKRHLVVRVSFFVLITKIEYNSYYNY